MSERLMKIILAPHISEKSARGTEKNRQFAFKVMKDAKKPEIKAAIEKLFNVKVDSVQTLNMKGRIIGRLRRQQGMRKPWKKAYVKLAEGHDIDMSGMKVEE